MTESEEILCEDCGEPIMRDDSVGVWVHEDYDADENHVARPPEETVW
jgi:hypothetical protein